MFQALLNEAIGQFNGAAAEACLLQGAHLRHTCGVEGVLARFWLLMPLKSQEVLLEALLAKYPHSGSSCSCELPTPS